MDTNKDPDDFLLDALDEELFGFEEEYNEDMDIDEERPEGFTGHQVLNDFSFPDWKRKRNHEK